MMNSIRGNPHEAQLVDYTRALVSSGTLEDETGVSTGWKQHGGLSITKDPERLKEFSMWSSLGKYMNWQTKMVDPQEIKYIHPLINTDGIVGGVYVPTDGSIDPTGKKAWVFFFLAYLLLRGPNNVADSTLCTYEN